MRQSIKVQLTMKVNEDVAKEVAYEVIKRANPHDSVLVDNKLEDAGITVESMARYFTELQLVVAEFWNGVADASFTTSLKPHEVRNLYLPLIYSVIFASVGNVTIGNYEYVLKANETQKVDRQWILEFSAKLETMRSYVLGDIGQIGNRNAQPQTSTMLAVLTDTVTDRSAQIAIRDGVTYDVALSGMSALAGLSLIENAYSILYTGLEEVNFRELASTVKQPVPKVPTPKE